MKIWNGLTAQQNSSYGSRPERVSEKLKGVPKSKESIEKRLATMKEKLSKMTKEERQAMFGRTWSDEKRPRFCNFTQKRKFIKRNIRKNVIF